MTTYADPTRCPDCRAVLPHDPQVCQICSLPLTGATAVSLFRTFQEADRLLGVLREEKRPTPAAAPVGVHASAASGTRLEGVTPYPAAARPASEPPTVRVSGASVPRILLSLGALCLLVAAVIFLAYAWRWLGVGGRTGVLVALTGTALGSTVLLHRRHLRTAAEAVAVVGLGLVVLDISGMRHAGWLGQITDAQTTMVAGTVATTVSLLLLLATSSRPLVTPGLIAPFATLVAGVASVTDVDSQLRVVVTCAALLALGRIGTAVRLQSMVAVSLVAGGIAWLALVADGFAGIADDAMTVSHVWGEAAAWPLVAAVVLMAVTGPAVGLGRTSTVVSCGLAGLLAGYVVALPDLDNGTTAAAESLLAVTAAWTAALVVLPRWRVMFAIPLAGTSVFPAVCAVGLLTSSFDAVTSVGEPFTRSVGVHVAQVYVDPSRWLLVPLLLVLVLAACALTSCVVTMSRAHWVAGAVTGVCVSVVASLPLYDVPLALVAGVLVLVAVAGFAWAETVSGVPADAARLGGLALIAATALLALPSDVMVTGVLLVACSVAAYLMSRTDTTAAVASLCFPPAFAALVWAGANAFGVDEQYRAVPVLLVLGALAIWRPQLELEASSVLAGTLVSSASVMLAGDLDVALAVHLTMAGVLVTTSSIVHPSRRQIAWAGGLLLAAATWVRLHDLGVHAPEAYTLPSALVLTAVGAWGLRHDDRSATLTVLAPGLALATVPSLVAMLDDPYSLRALLLGAACLGLVVGGAALRWGAPLVVGAVVGAALVLRELAPYAAHVPSWLTIGLSGAVLLAVGITWESRMQDVRRASRYVTALR